MTAISSAVYPRASGSGFIQVVSASTAAGEKASGTAMAKRHLRVVGAIAAAFSTIYFPDKAVRTGRTMIGTRASIAPGSGMATEVMSRRAEAGDMTVFSSRGYAKARVS
jgi:hypothetical protein